ncbi:putative RNA recognition motif domain, nucleotide-binding alpha-beta plait domain superfamily [Helianthus anomalus]
MFDGEGPWNQATRRKRNRKPYVRKNYFEFDNATTLSVSNLPGYCVRGEVWDEFRNFGNLKDVFIPNKVDRQGNRFAFICLKNIGDLGKTLEVLNKIKIKGAKLAIDMTKFRRDGKPFDNYNGKPVEKAKMTHSYTIHTNALNQVRAPNGGRGNGPIAGNV